MPKLLTWKEAQKIANRMCEEVGLPRPYVSETQSYFGSNRKVTIEVYRYKKPILGIKRTEKLFECDEGTLESALIRLEKDLEYKLKNQLESAEHLRGKWDKEDADATLDIALRYP